MAWQLVAIVVIVVATVVWFIRDERRIRAEARLVRAAGTFAHAPKYRFMSPQPQPKTPEKPRQSSLLRNDRAFFDEMLARRTKR